MTFAIDPAKEYRKFEKQRNSNLRGCRLGKQVLYDLCKKHPQHTDEDEIFSKVWLIGRALSAAVERGCKPKNRSTRDFYWASVVPAIMRDGKAVDKEIAELNKTRGELRSAAPKVLALHKRLQEALKQATGTDKRSLVAKYLHFHCPNHVFLYDSQACAAARAIARDVKPGDKWDGAFDGKYNLFVARSVAIAEEIERKSGIKATPRDIDDFLYHFSIEKKLKGGRETD